MSVVPDMPEHAGLWRMGWRFTRDDVSVPEARRRVGVFCAGCPRWDDVSVVVSELVTNAVRHSRGGWVWLEVDSRADGLLVRVRDGGGGSTVPCFDRGPVDGECGRGLEIVKALCAEHGAQRAAEAAGWIVWGLVAHG